MFQNFNRILAHFSGLLGMYGEFLTTVGNLEYFIFDKCELMFYHVREVIDGPKLLTFQFIKVTSSGAQFYTTSSGQIDTQTSKML